MTPCISKSEKLAVNVFTPLLYVYTKFFDRDEQESFRDMAANKIEIYERLLEHLSSGYDESAVGLYMDFPCGRIQVLLARTRGFLTGEQYKDLAKKYPIQFR